MPRSTLLLSAALALALPAAALGETKPRTGDAARPFISYFLPQTIFTAQATQTLVACPEAAGELPAIDTQWALAAGAEPDPKLMVKVDISRGFLAERSTALVLRTDGTLDSFNATSTGQGGTVIQSVLKLAVAAAPLLSMDMGPTPPRPPDPRYRCTDAASAALAASAKLGEQIAELEGKIAAGDTSPAITELIDRLRTRRAALRAGLTRSAQAGAMTPSADEATTGKLTIIDPGEPRIRWFEPAATGFFLSQVSGAAGLGIKLQPADGTMLDAVRHGDGTIVSLDSHRPMPRLVYRRPIVATVTAGPCTSTDCSDIASDAAVQAPVAQWSGLYSLSVGRGGLFGHREAHAKFDPYGTPLELSYGSSPGAADIAGAIDGATGFAAAVRDSELTALERQIKLEEARQKLRELRNAD